MYLYGQFVHGEDAPVLGFLNYYSIVNCMLEDDIYVKGLQFGQQRGSLVASEAMLKLMEAKTLSETLVELKTMAKLCANIVD